MAKWDLEALLWLGLEKLLALFALSLLFVLLKKCIHPLVNRVLAPSLKFYRQDAARVKTLSRLMENLLNYLLYFLILYWGLAILGLPVTSLLAGAGLAGVVIGLGAQGFLSDIVNGFFMLIEHQFDVGDLVKFNQGTVQISGHVANMGIRTTQIRDSDGTLHFVPNRHITLVSNLSRGAIRVLIDLPLAPTVDVAQVTRILTAVNTREVGNYPAIVGAPQLLGVQFSAIGQFSYRVVFFATSGQQTSLYHAFYAHYQAALLAEGIPLTPTLATG